MMTKRKWLKLMSFSAIVLLVCTSAVFAWPVPDTGDPNERTCNPHSYTDLGNGIVQDHVTGLMWQKATARGTYTWDAAVAYCHTLILGGYTDWRLPTIKELSTLEDSSVYDPVINTTYFSDTVSSFYWSSTTFAVDASDPWAVYFKIGQLSPAYDKTNSWYVRAVRGEPLKDNDFIDNGDGTVSDTETGLMWQQATAPGTYTWDDAKTYCDNLTLGGQSDWRLPTKNELQTLVDYNSTDPSIDTVYFPDTVFHLSLYWSSTAYAYDTPSAIAWWVSFSIGSVQIEGSTATSYNYVRAVRGGQCGPVTTTTTVTSGTTTTTINSGPNPCPAEAIYGEDSEETELLREYRDNVLSKTPDGQEFIKNYYKLSPSVTKLFEQRPLLKNRAKAFVDSMLPEIRKKVEESNEEP